MLTPAQQYIEDRIERVTESGCWIWIRALKGKGWETGDGYGACWFSGAYHYAHHLAWEAYRGPSNGLHVLHTCDIPSCCNPAHLRLGTNDDNIRDKVSKGRHLHGETHNMVKLTAEEVLAIRASNESEVVLAARYGVCRSNIGMIRRRVKWSHI